MTSKKHRMIMYGVAVHLFLIAIVCYAAFPVNPPEEPIRLMYYTNAGKVLFDHQTHTSAQGFGLDCGDCHHTHPEGEEFEPVACGLCHPPRPADKTIPESCLECHDTEEIENTEIMKRADSLHAQCTQCHEGFGRGPLHQSSLSDEAKEALKAKPNPWVACNKCHNTY